MTASGLRSNRQGTGRVRRPAIPPTPGGSSGIRTPLIAPAGAPAASRAGPTMAAGRPVPRQSTERDHRTATGATTTHGAAGIVGHCATRTG